MDYKLMIRDFISENIAMYDENITFADDDDIFELGYANSIFALKLVTFIEKQFNFRVANNDLELSNFSSVSNIEKFIKKKQGVA